MACAGQHLRGLCVWGPHPPLPVRPQHYQCLQFQQGLWHDGVRCKQGTAVATCQKLLGTPAMWRSRASIVKKRGVAVHGCVVFFIECRFAVATAVRSLSCRVTHGGTSCLAWPLRRPFRQLFLLLLFLPVGAVATSPTLGSSCVSSSVECKTWGHSCSRWAGGL